MFVFTLLSLMKPLSFYIEKAEELAEISNKDIVSPNSQDDFEKTLKKSSLPGEFSDLNKHLKVVYKNIQKKGFRLAHEKAELKAIAAAVSDSIIAIDKNYKVIFLNPQSLNLFPKASSSDSLQGIVQSEEILKSSQKCLETGEKFNFDLTMNAGEQRQSCIFEISISPLIHTQNKIDGAVIVLFDKTAIKNTEKSHTDFVSNVSHELKTPLTSIKGFVETMMNDLKEKNFDQIQNFLDIVSRNVRRLIMLIDDLLSLSHIDSISHLDKQEVDTREITAVACESISKKDHKVNYIFKADTVLASRQWLEQVLYNLVQNAVKYTPQGSQIDVIWEKHPHFILLTVKDDGEGIPLQHQSRIFERFYRVEEDRSREKGGTGIGLAIVKQVMEKHGGHVYLTSRRRGKGAKLTCTFPR